MDQQRVLITGGAGFLGINLTRHLLSRGYAVASLDVEEFDYPERDRVEIIKGDIRNKALVNRVVEGADFVVHTAAALPLYSPEDIYTTDVEGTRNVLDAASRAGAGPVVHISSVVVYGYDDPSEQDDDVFHRTYGIPYIDTKSASDALALRRGRGAQRGDAAREPLLLPPVDPPMSLDGRRLEPAATQRAVQRRARGHPPAVTRPWCASRGARPS